MPGRPYFGVDVSGVEDPIVASAISYINTYLLDYFRFQSSIINTVTLALGAVSSVTLNEGASSSDSLPLTETSRILVNDFAPTVGATGVLAIYKGLYETDSDLTAPAGAVVRLYVNGTERDQARVGDTTLSVSTATANIVSQHTPTLLWFETGLDPSITHIFEITDARLLGSVDADAKYRGDLTTGKLVLVELKR